MIHGWGLHSGIWDEFAPLLQDAFRVTRVDLPGHGRSDWRGEASLDEWVDAVLAVVPAVRSLAGMVAWWTGCDACRPAGSRGRLRPWSRWPAPPVLCASRVGRVRCCRHCWRRFSVELAQDYARTLNRFLSLQVRGSEQASAVLKSLRATLLAHGEPDTAGLGAGLAILRATDLRDGYKGNRSSLPDDHGGTGHAGAGECRQGNPGTGR